MILPKTAFGLAMSIILFRRFFKEIPEELREAAARRWLRAHPLLLVEPAAALAAILATVATIQFVQTWNNYILPLVLLNTEEKYPGRSASCSTRANTCRSGTSSSPSSP